jgi:dihydroorotate dehydrogenase
MELDKLIIGNAAGTAPGFEGVSRLCMSAATRITTGPVTLHPRPGNGGQVYAYNPISRASINSLGLPSLGLEKLSRYVLPPMIQSCNAARKELRVSIVGFSVEEWEALIIGCWESGVRHVELNFGCPNVWGPEGRKPMPSYDPELAMAIFDSILATVKYMGGLNVGVKLSPVEDDRILSELADVLMASGIVSEVVSSNTIPDQSLMMDNGSHGLGFTVGGDSSIKNIGGLAGAPLLKRSVLNVGMLRTWLPQDIRIIGCGGIFSGVDVQKYLQAGVAGFECATAYVEQGPRIFSDIVAELIELESA